MKRCLEPAACHLQSCGTSLGSQPLLGCTRLPPILPAKPKLKSQDTPPAKNPKLHGMGRQIV